MKPEKKRMNSASFIKIWTPILSVLLAVLLIANIAAVSTAATIDAYLGKGARHVTVPEGSESWNTEYYTPLASTPDEARVNAESVAERVGDEGEVLLKNNGVLPLAQGSTVMPFGYAYLNPAYSGTGAGAADASNNVAPQAALESRFTVDDKAVKAMQSAQVVELTEAPGTAQAKIDNGLLASDSAIYGYDPTIFTGIDGAGSTAVVFLTRQGNEGADKKMDGYTDGTPHYLALSEMEKETIRAAKSSCDKAVVILVSSNAMELSPLMSGELEADAILWVGNPGARGFMSMAKILCGEVNPSGRLVDIYAADFTKDPTYQNMGEFSYSNISYVNPSILQRPGETINSFYIEYQESIYSGYRYYETAQVMDPDFVYGELDGQGAVTTPGAVCYPFGYGLSYTRFEQTISEFHDSGDEISATITVKNVGDAEGKDVVQLYYSAPYTQLDADSLIEKSAVNLVAFGKTGLLKPGASEDVTLTFAKEDMASYCYTRQNPDGTIGCYMLEEGEYTVSLRANSHDVLDEKIVSIPSTIWYDNTNPRQSERDAQSARDDEGNPLDYPAGGAEESFTAATNQFQESSDYMNRESSLLTRSDWANTFPAMAPGRTKEGSDITKQAVEDSFAFNYETDAKLGNVEGSAVYTDKMPTSDADNGLSLSSLRGKDFNDPIWEDLLDQINYDAEMTDIQALLFTAGYQTGKIDSIGKPATTEQDGDTGLNIGMSTCAWMSKPVVASTWNLELMYEVGTAVGQEALTDGLNGWYAPGMNIHRSPFSGRNLEYFSEDGLLSGRMAAAMISGCGDQGLYCFVKHFAVNDQETNRENFIHTWADEQTMREIYFRPFEVAFKEAKMTVKYISDDQGTISTRVMPAATGVMTAQSCIGPTICFANYGLLTGVLRGEWGFDGGVLTDLYFVLDPWLRDKMLRAGGDMYLMMNIDQVRSPAADCDSATARSLIREAIHHVSYMVVNSAAMNHTAPGAIVTYDTSPWIYLVIAIDLVVAAFIVVMTVLMVKRHKDNKLHPEKYTEKPIKTDNH